MRQNVIQKAGKKPGQWQPNQTGIPTQMKLDVESRSGLSLDDMRVHYHSDKPAKIGALAYTQGNQVHIGPGQERHLLHELGHVVQQKTTNVVPTASVAGYGINNDPKLEAQADRISQSSTEWKPAASAPVIQGKFPDGVTANSIYTGLLADYEIKPLHRNLIMRTLDELQQDDTTYEVAEAVEKLRKLGYLRPKVQPTEYRYADKPADNPGQALKDGLRKLYDEKKKKHPFKPTKTEIFSVIAGVFTKTEIDSALKDPKIVGQLQWAIREVIQTSEPFKQKLITDAFNFFDLTEIYSLDQREVVSSLPSDDEISANTPEWLKIDRFTLRHYTKTPNPQYREILSSLSLENQRTPTSTGGHTEDTDWNTFGNVGNTFFVLKVGDTFVCKQEFVRKCPAYVDIPLRAIKTTMWVSSDWLDVKGIKGKAYMGTAEQIYAVLLKIVVQTCLGNNPAGLRKLSEEEFAAKLGGMYHNFEVKVMGSVVLPSTLRWEANKEYAL